MSVARIGFWGFGTLAAACDARRDRPHAHLVVVGQPGRVELALDRVEVAHRLHVTEPAGVAPSAVASRVRSMFGGFDELAQIDDADELCRQLLVSPSGWGESTRHEEATELLAKVSDRADLPRPFVALLLCACWRWYRATAKLIAAIEDSGLLSGAELDELADSLLAHELVVSYPESWLSESWLEIDLDTGESRSIPAEDERLIEHRPSLQPPLRRWAARRALRADPARLDDLLARAELFEPRHRDALIGGLLDAADSLSAPQRRTLVDRGLASAQASVRRRALDRLCELDGPEKARRRARSDRNAAVRRWRPPSPQVELLAA